MRSPDEALFDFALAPLPEIEGWGEPDHRTLHWFALTRGRYWMNVGDQQLFTLSPTIAQTPPFDYHVAQLWGDSLNALPTTLEAVPMDLAARVSDSDWLGWNQRVQTWMNEPRSLLPADIDALALALGWADERRLNASYWVGGPNVWMCRIEDVVRISWDNRALVWDGVPLWTASVGAYDLSVTRFLDELAKFDQRLIEAMAARIAQVRAGGTRASGNIDIPRLEHEQAERTLALGRARAGARAITPTDWGAVRNALLALERAVPVVD